MIYISFSACGPNSRTIYDEHHSNAISSASGTLKADKLEETATGRAKMVWKALNNKNGHFVVNLGCQQSFTKILLRNNNGEVNRATNEFRLF